MVDMAWSTKSFDQNNSLVAGQILIEGQFTKPQAGVTNNLLSYNKERDHFKFHLGRFGALLAYIY
jgi:hypothetical protein